MIVQLFVALVKAVRRSKKCNRVRNMNGYGYIELRTGFPHWIESWIVYFDESSGRDVLSQIEPERLQNLQPSRAIAMRLLDRLSLQLWILRLFESLVRRLSKGVEPAGISVVISRNRVGQPFFIPSSKVDHGADVLPLHDLQHFLWRSQILPLRGKLHPRFRFRRHGKMSMDINQGKFRLRNPRLVHMQHALRLVLRQVEWLGRRR